MTKLTRKDLTDRKLKELYYNNLSFKEIGDMYDCSISYVSRRVKKLIDDDYIIKRPNTRKRILSEEDLKCYNLMTSDKDNLNNRRISSDEIVSLFLNGLERREISTVLECSYQTVVSVIHDYNEKGADYSLKYGSEIVLYILELYSNYITHSLISKICNMSFKSIDRIINNAIESGKIQKRITRSSRLNNNTLQIIDMYRAHYSISIIADKLNKSYKEVDLLIENMIKNGRVKKRDTKNKYKNLLIMKADRNRVLSMYKNNISIENIADYYQVSTKQVKMIIESIEIFDKIDIKNPIYKMIVIDKKKPREIESELGIPTSVIYKYLTQKNIC